MSQKLSCLWVFEISTPFKHQTRLLNKNKDIAITVS